MTTPYQIDNFWYLHQKLQIVDDNAYYYYY